MIKSYRDLDVWQSAFKLANEVYDVTDHFPSKEIYGLTSQLRRAAISAPSNIAEGSARSGTKDLMRFIDIAQGSVAEIETQLLLSHSRQYLSQEILDNLLNQCGSVNRMLTRLYQSLEKKVA